MVWVEWRGEYRKDNSMSSKTKQRNKRSKEEEGDYVFGKVLQYNNKEETADVPLANLSFHGFLRYIARSPVLFLKSAVVAPP